MSGAIANALPKCNLGALEQVGFALSRKLLLKITNRKLRQEDHFPQPVRVLGANRKCNVKAGRQFSTAHPAMKLGETLRFRYNSKTQFCHDAPVAQLDRVHGYEP